MPERSYLSIGDVLSLLQGEFPDITISKIRFLESQGLLDPERTPSGYRKFYDEDVARLRYILRQQREHFLPLKVIRDRLDVEGDLILRPPSAVAGVRSPGGGLSGEDLATADDPDAAREAGQPAGAGREPAGRPVTTARGPGAERAGSHMANGQGARADHPVAVGAAPPGSGSMSGPPGSGVAGSGAAWAARQEGGPGREHLGGTGRGGVPGPPASPGSSTPPPRERHTIDPRGGRPGGQPLETGPGERLPSPSSQSATTQSELPGPEGGATSGLRRTSELGAALAGLQEPPRRPPAPQRDEPPPGRGAPARSGPTPSSASDGDFARPPMRLSKEELATASGLGLEQVEDLERYGLLVGETQLGVVVFDEEALKIAKVAAGFLAHGLEARHLQGYRRSAEREVDLFEQVITPLLRQRNPNARHQAAESLDDLARLGATLRNELVRSALRHLRSE